MCLRSSAESISIDTEAFSGCQMLLNLDLPDSLATIGYNAFYLVRNINYSGSILGSPWGAIYRNGYIDGDLIYSDSTRTVVVGSRVTIDTINFPASVTEIHYCAFANCDNLTSITIPSQIISLQPGAFYHCPYITTVYYNAVNAIVTGVGTPFFINSLNDQIESHWTLVVDSHVLTVPNYLCNYCSTLDSVVMGDSVIFIGQYAFANCDNLKHFAMHNQVGAIGQYAFSECSRLQDIAISNTLSSLENNAFYECSTLTHVDLSATLITLQNAAFGNCTSLYSMVLPASLTSIGANAFWSCSALSSITFSDSLINIGNSAFRNCVALSEIELPAHVATLGNSTFYGCTGHTHIVSHNPIPPTCGTNTFRDVDKTIPVVVPSSSSSAYAAANGWSEFFNLSSYYQVTVAPNDSALGSTTGGGTFSYGSTATITATPADHCHLTVWNDGNTSDTRTIVVTSDTAFVAFFDRDQNTVTALSNDNGMGHVSGGGTYPYGDTVMLTAIAEPHHHLAEWSDGTTQSTLAVVLTCDTTITAYFAIDQHTVTATPSDNAMGSTSGGGTFNYGDTAATISLIVDHDTAFTAYFEPIGQEDINTSEDASIRVFAGDMSICVTGGEGLEIRIMDLCGRTLHHQQHAGSHPYRVPSAGVYFVQIANRPAIKVSVVR